MKGFISSVLIFITVITGLFLYNKYITVAFEKTLSFLDEIELCVEKEDFTRAEELSLKFDRELRGKAYWLYFVTDRAPIDNAITESARLKSFLKSKDDAEALAVLSGVRVMLIKMVEKSLLRIENIL